MSKQIFDYFIIVFFFPIFFLIFLLIYLMIFIVDGQPVLYISSRVGRNNSKFKMIKFRTLKKNSPLLSSENFAKLKSQKNFFTKTGKFLKKFKLDELPQIINVFLLQMSFVGPRPALPLQKKLVKMRSDKKIHLIRPGITGLAQINNFKIHSIEEKVKYDQYYLKKRNLFLDIKIILITILTIFSK
jgi:O-antigen biosynthesis protein WbqP